MKCFMSIEFNIDYGVVSGQKLQINIVCADGQTDGQCMTSTDGYHWTGVLSMEEPLDGKVDYYYSVVNDGTVERREWRVEAHRLVLDGMETESVAVYDKWIDIPEDAFLYSSAFTDCITNDSLSRGKQLSYGRTVCLKVRAPQLRKGEKLFLTGAGEQLGDWEKSAALPMTECNYREWTVNLDADRIAGGVMEFKFVAMNDDRLSLLWELGDNRRVDVAEKKDRSLLVYELSAARFPIEPWRGAGTVIPVFSLRSDRSFGVGDFGDLKLMVDWLTLTGQQILQVLPINDTTVTHTAADSYPYSCISIYALHPQYIDLNALPPLADKAKRTEFEALRRELNALQQIDYVRVNRAKTAYLRLLFAQEGDKTLRSAAFKRFFTANRHWLVPYAAFCCHRDEYGTADFRQWSAHGTFSDSDRRKWERKGTKEYSDAAFHYCVQFWLDAQMRDAHDYARKRSVILKGDIPIGINRNSVEAWVEPYYFNLDKQAGAPPDAFSANGQNWGFPTYNWERMLEDGCRWWVGRFGKMSQYFDAYRIDHVLGFFRIWEIPGDCVHATLGQFSPSLPMSKEEIEGYGVQFREELFTRPYITDLVLADTFGDGAQEVREKYLDSMGQGRYSLKSEYDTQRKIEAAFGDVEDGNAVSVRDGLYSLVSDVLFVRDNKDCHMYHPRISAQTSHVYQTLGEEEKQAFNCLYEDYFYHRNSHFWYREAMRKLPLLTQSTRMLTCAEDLGMVPECVPWAMNELRILSLEIQSMPKEMYVRFGTLAKNPYRSVATISTHDMPTLRQWWDEDSERTQDYYNNVLCQPGAAPHPLPGSVAADIVKAHLECPSMLCLISLQDWLAIDENLRLADADAERINVPADAKHYWRYRMHVNIEKLIGDETFCRQVRRLVSDAGR